VLLGQLFLDGFETGDIDEWSRAVLRAFGR
jgi:hypothetical protein